MELHTKSLLLREYTPDDAPVLVHELAPIEMSRYTANIPHPYTLADAQSYITLCLTKQKEEPRTMYSFAITRESKLIGDVCLIKVDRWGGTAEIGYWVSQAHAGKGFAQEAARRVIDFAFEDLGLNRIDLHAHVENGASNHIADKLGFTLEGTLRQGSRPKPTGTYGDKNVYGLLKSEWNSQQQ
jgi:ribosomal-protein-alanine N-acetyltransferase